MTCGDAQFEECDGAAHVRQTRPFRVGVLEKFARDYPGVKYLTFRRADHLNCAFRVLRKFSPSGELERKRAAADTFEPRRKKQFPQSLADERVAARSLLHFVQCSQRRRCARQSRRSRRTALDRAFARDDRSARTRYASQFFDCHERIRNVFQHEPAVSEVESVVGELKVRDVAGCKFQVCNSSRKFSSCRNLSLSQVDCRHTGNFCRNFTGDCPGSTACVENLYSPRQPRQERRTAYETVLNFKSFLFRSGSSVDVEQTALLICHLSIRLSSAVPSSARVPFLLRRIRLCTRRGRRTSRSIPR